MQTSGAIIVAVAAAAGGYFSWGTLVDTEKSDSDANSASVGDSGDMGSKPTINLTKPDPEGLPPESEQNEGSTANPEPEVQLPAVLVGLSPADYPAKVKLLEDIDFTYRGDASVPPVPHQKDSLVVPLNMEGKMLTLTPRLTGSLRATVPYDKTDFLQRVEEMKKGGSLAESGANDDSADEPSIELIGEEMAIALVKKDILSGRISELNADRVKGFQYEGLKKNQGQDAEVVVVEFDAETLLGIKRVGARAVIRNNAVDRWEWATTGFEMR